MLLSKGGPLAVEGGPLRKGLTVRLMEAGSFFRISGEKGCTF